MINKTEHERITNIIDGRKKLKEQYEEETGKKNLVAFHKWLKENDTPERAEEWFHYSDEDMYRAFKEEQFK